MTVYEIPNIEHCTITERLNGRVYQIVTNDGWYIHLRNGVEDTQHVWTTIVILNADEDFSIVEIRPEADLSHDAEICGGGSNETAEN